MTTRTMGLIVLGVGALAAVILLVTATSGLDLDPGAELAGLRPHLLQGLVAVLLLTLSHAWVVLFLFAGSWAVAASARDAGAAAAEGSRRRRRLVRGVLPFALIAVVLAVASLWTGTRTFTEDLGAVWHRWLSWAAIAAQVVAWVAEWRGLTAFDGELQRLRPGIEAGHASGSPVGPGDGVQ